MEPPLFATSPDNKTSKQIPLNIIESPTPATNVFMRGAGYFVRLALLAGLVLVIRSEHRWQQAQLAGTGPECVTPEDVRTFLPQATTLGAVSPSNASRSVLGPNGQTLGWFVQTAPKSDSVIGYSGTTNCLLVFDHENRLAGVQILDSGDTADHVRDVQDSSWFLSQWHDQTWKTAPSLEVDSVSGATLTSLGIVDSIRTRLGDPQPNLRFPDPPDMDRIQSFFPTADRIEAKQTGGVFDVLDGRGNRLGQLRGTSPAADSVVGYQGPTETVLAIDVTGKVIGLWIQKSYDNQPYVGYVDQDAYFKEKFQGQTLVELASRVESIEEIEGVSGATMTSQAVAAAIAVTATIPTKETPSHGIRWHASSRDLGTCLVLGLGLTFCFSKLRGWRFGRVLFQIFLVLYFGFLNGDLISIALLAGWSQSGMAWNLAPGMALLGCATLIVPATSRRQLYCHHICPFGAAQQLLKGKLPWKVRLPRRLHKLLRFLPYFLLLTALGSTMLNWPINLASLEPFDAFVFWIAGPISLGIAATGLIASSLVPMAYCKYGCPTGEILSLFRRTTRKHLWNKQDGLAAGLLLVAILLRIL